MIANYHTHTPRCMHAVGTEEEYIRCAVASGLQILGFSDHTPYPFPNGYTSTFRMAVPQLEDYANAVRKAAKQYAGQIQIHLGVEAEYYPQLVPQMLSLLRDQGVEYMILGQHILGNEWDLGPAGFLSGDVHKLEAYCNQVIDAMYTGLFTYLAHPDLFHFAGDKQVYQAQISRICRAAKACQRPLELNLLGMHLKRNYPNPDFFEMAAQEGCQVILGKDAHQPEFLLDHTIEQQALSFLDQFGLVPVETVALRPI